MQPYRCNRCHGNLTESENLWRCDNCGNKISLYQGEVPVFYTLNSLANQDASLKKHLYDGILGKFYSFLMPFLSLPVRPLNRSVWQWILYVLIVAVLATGYGSIVDLFLGQMPSLLTGVLIFLSVLVTIFALSNRMFGWLLVLAIPLKLNHLVRNFEPKSSFTDIHQKIVDQHSERQRLKVLDVSTGTCNSLLRHGWINLDADYFGIDLSETMIIQGKMNCEKDGVEIKLALGDACDLPYEDTYFDLVLNYGAVNGYSDIEAAVSEMYRVLKPGGTMVIYDEQLYDERNFLEELYFSKVLSPHDMIHSCPTFAIPKGASYSVNQVYPYYYLCVVEKPG